MKHINNYQMFENKVEIDTICAKYGITNYTINDDGSIDVDGNVNLSKKGLTKLPLKFNRVTGSFYCADNELTSLKGCPDYVGGDFYCSYNRLITLEGCPDYVGREFHCAYNPIFAIVRLFNPFGGNYIGGINNNLMEIFNYYDIVQGTNVIYDRLKYFLSLFHIVLSDYHRHMIEKEGYTIIGYNLS